MSGAGAGWGTARLASVGLLACAAGTLSVTQELQAQTATQELPPLTVEGTAPKQAKAAPKKTAPAAPKQQAAPAPAGPVPNAIGDIGYEATRTSTATKTDTPLRNVPQSVSVVTEQQMKDQGFKSISDVSKYVPGVQIHQGEGNRDQISIRGQVASTADFFLNGVRDDGQVFRDLYNTDRVEILKGPTALIFGRGGAGGVVNRVTKEADFRTFQEA